MTTLTEKVISALTGRMTDEELRAIYNCGCDGDMEKHLEVYVEARRARGREKRMEMALREIVQSGRPVITGEGGVSIRVGARAFDDARLALEET